jgi:hypothetical protein
MAFHAGEFRVHTVLYSVKMDYKSRAGLRGFSLCSNGLCAEGVFRWFWFNANPSSDHGLPFLGVEFANVFLAVACDAALILVCFGQ